MAADLIITHARGLTMDDAIPRCEAIAVKGNEILALGANAEIAAHRAKHTRMIDAQGATVMPGFNESHLHIFMGAGELDNLDLSGVYGFENLKAAILGFASARPALDLVYANQVSYSVLDPVILPTRHDLDRIIPDRPFAMMCYDHHTVFANTKALERAGVLRGAAVPTGSEIVMAADGLASGELREPGAFRYILALTPTGGRDSLGFTEAAEPHPPPTPAQRATDRAVLLRGLRHCASFGITSMHNMDGNFYTLELLKEIEEAGDFTARCQSPFHFKNYFGIERLADASDMHQRYASERVSSGRVKLFMDGVLESWTALTLEDYPDRPGHFGDPNFTAEAFNAIAIEADSRGLQIDVHAIAAGAVRRTLDGYAAARRANSRRDSRHRIEHIEVIDPADLPRLKSLGVIASVQPTHCPGPVFPPEPTMARIRKRDLPRAYAWQTIRETGAPICFNSDWPVAPLDPMISIHAALTRQPLSPEQPAQKQTLMDTLKAYTSGGAYAEFMEHRKGTLKPGMLADIVVLSGDVEAAEDVRTLKAAVTICDGLVTHG
jgi:predicted amidohydrolase YtcJ